MFIELAPVAQAVSLRKKQSNRLFHSLAAQAYLQQDSMRPTISFLRAAEIVAVISITTVVLFSCTLANILIFYC
jgi:membrane glycosyltransferase